MKEKSEKKTMVKTPSMLKTISFVYGYLFSSTSKDTLKLGILDELGDYKKQYEQIAMCEFNPTETHECIVSKVNDYTLKVNTMEQ